LPTRADKLVREYRDERGREVESLERLAARLGVPEDETEEIIVRYLAYELTYEEARRELERVASRVQRRV